MPSKEIYVGDQKKKKDADLSLPVYWGDRSLNDSRVNPSYICTNYIISQ